MLLLQDIVHYMILLVILETGINDIAIKYWRLIYMILQLDFVDWYILLLEVLQNSASKYFFFRYKNVIFPSNFIDKMK